VRSAVCCVFYVSLLSHTNSDSIVDLVLVLVGVVVLGGELSLIWAVAVVL